MNFIYQHLSPVMNILYLKDGFYFLFFIVWWMDVWMGCTNVTKMSSECSNFYILKTENKHKNKKNNKTMMASPIPPYLKKLIIGDPPKWTLLDHHKNKQKWNHDPKTHNNKLVRAAAHMTQKCWSYVHVTREIDTISAGYVCDSLVLWRIRENL